MPDDDVEDAPLPITLTQIIIGDEEDPYKDGFYIQCPWCKRTSKETKFVIGSIFDDDDKEVAQTICPQCTNVFFPSFELQGPCMKAIKFDFSELSEDQVVIVKDIVDYCRRHHDGFKFSVKGKVPKVKNSLIPDASSVGVPKEHIDR